MKNSFGKDIISGGVANFLIAISHILRSIFIVRLIGANSALDSYYLGISIIQIFVFNPVSIFVNSGQPNIVKGERKYVSTYILMGLLLIILIHAILYIAINYVYKWFTSSQALLLYLHDFTNYLFILSMSQSIFILLTAIVKSVVNIKSALLIEITGSLLITLFLILLSIKTPIDFLKVSALIYTPLAIISFMIIYNHIDMEIILNRQWLKKILYNIKNYLISFVFSATTGWYEKFTLALFPGGELAIFSIVSKAISPIMGVLISPSVLLVSFAANSMEKSKEFLASYIALSINVLTLVIISATFFASVGLEYLPQLLNVNYETSVKIVDVFQLLSLTVFSSIIYTGFLRFLGAFNKSNYILYLNIVGTVQLILFYTVLKQYMIQGIALSIVINSFLLSAYAILLFVFKLDFKLRKVISLFSKKMIALFLICVLFVTLEIINSSLFDNPYIECSSYLILLAGYLSQYKKIRGLINNFN